MRQCSALSAAKQSAGRWVLGSTAVRQGCSVVEQSLFQDSLQFAAIRELTMRIETIAVHAGHHPDPVTGAVIPPIHLSTTFEREADLSYRAGFVYSLLRLSVGLEHADDLIADLDGALR